MFIRRAIGLTVLACLCVALTSGVAAAAKPKPHISAAVSAHATVGSTINVKYSGTHLPSGSKLILERRKVGHSYSRIRSLKGHAGTVKVASPAMGSYYYRVEDLVHGKVPAVSAAHLERAYGHVSFQHMCLLDNNSVWMYPFTGQTCPPLTETIGKSRFTYVTGTYDADYGGTQTGGVNVKTSCRWVRVLWAVSPEGDGLTTSAIIKQGTKVVRVNLAGNTIGSHYFTLNSSPWTMYLGITRHDDLDEVDANGYADCYTSSGAA